ncbi:MAG: hypothetical protein ACYC3G_00650 [Minisyncoccota bacterium]
MRNFWIEGEVDGRKTVLTGGPRSKDGGFTLTVFIKDHGTSRKALQVDGFVNSTGELVLIAQGLKVTDGDGITITAVR